MGRPTIFADDLTEELIKRLSEGEPLAAICRDARMPGTQTVRDWMARDEAFSVAIARARELGFDAIAADALSIVDNTQEDPASRRVRADTRLKLLAKWDPKRYGDAMLHKHADADGGKIELDPVARATRLAAIFADIEKAKGGDVAD